MAASWSLVPCLACLRTEFNTLAPARDRASDGSIGDASHAASVSDHNPDSRGLVHAIDTDDSGPWPAGVSMEKCVQTIVMRHRTGLDNRLQNVIYMRRIWSRSWGWTAREYTGPSPHTEHAHFSARYAVAQENDTRPWGLLDLLEDDMPLADDKIAITPDTAEEIGKRAGESVSASILLQLAVIRAARADEKAAAAVTKLDAVLAQLKVLTGRDFVDEPAIIAGILAGLDPEVIGAAIPKELAAQVADVLYARLQS